MQQNLVHVFLENEDALVARLLALIILILTRPILTRLILTRLIMTSLILTSRR